MPSVNQLDLNSLSWPIAAVFLLWQVRSYMLRRRSRKMIELGEELDVEYDRLHNDDITRCLRATKLGAKHPNAQICNAMGCEVEQTRLMVFDYQYSIPGGRGHRCRQTITALLPTRENFPDFQMRPEGVLEKIGAWIAMQDIDFPEHPEFSSQYVLQADHEAFIRQFFDAAILEFFADHPGWWIESSRRGLILYKKNRVMNPQEIKEAMAIAVQAFELFEAQAARLLTHELSEVKGLSCSYWLPDAVTTQASH